MVGTELKHGYKGYHDVFYGLMKQNKNWINRPKMRNNDKNKDLTTEILLPNLNVSLYKT